MLEELPEEEKALQLAAPAVAVAANQSKLVGHTAPLLPTPPSMTTIAAAAAAASIGSGSLAGAVPAMAAALASSVSHRECHVLGGWGSKITKRGLIIFLYPLFFFLKDFTYTNSFFICEILPNAPSFYTCVILDG